MSGKRYELLATNEIYHVLNKTVGYEDIFIKNKEIQRILELIDYYRFNPKLSFSKYKNLPVQERKEFYQKIRLQHKVVEIYAYAFMPNHFHLLIKQIEEKGIQKFLSNIQNGYAKYFNLKNKRNGTLFQKPFKAKRVVNNEIFLHTSRYIHLNPVTSYLINQNELKTDPRTSLHYYQETNVTSDIINTKPLIEISGSQMKYLSFVFNQVDIKENSI